MKLLKILLLLILSQIVVFAEDPFADGGGGDSVFEEDGGNEIIDRMIFLDAIQERFWHKDRKPNANTINIIHKAGDSHKIRTRANMTTTFVFDEDKIAQVILGDSVGFEMKEIPDGKYSMPNILTIKPTLVGIDTNLTIIGENGNIYTFYIFSTDHKNRRDPAFLVFVSEKRPVGKIKVKNIEKEENEKALKKLDESGRAKPNEEVIESESDNEIIIGDKVNKISINKNEIRKNYTQKPKTNFLGVVSEDSQKLMAKDIFNDNKWTYFKFDRNLATSKFPAIFRVVDGYDNPMNSRIVGNYLIVETIADKWTLRIGDEYVCVRGSGN